MPLRLGHQFGDITPLTDRRLQMCAELGVEDLAIHTTPVIASQHPLLRVFAADGSFDAQALRRLRRHIESFGMRVTAVHQDLDTFHADAALARNPERVTALLERVGRNIEAAASAGIPAIKYNLQLIGILRTGREPGRGGISYHRFDAERATPELLRQHSVFIDQGQERTNGELPRITAEGSWRAIERLVESVLPAAERAGVYLACHPQDPPLPAGGLHGVEHVVGSIDGLKRFAALSGSRYHVLNFCQGTVAEMCADPARDVIDAIRYFGGLGKIYMVHFRNIRGGHLHFSEVHVDDGSVDMREAMRAYQEVGFDGLLAPDHVPRSTADPDNEIQFGFALGYIRGLIQCVSSEEVVRAPA